VNRQPPKSVEIARLLEGDAPARLNLHSDIVAYVDKAVASPFLEEGIVRFEGTNIVVHSRVNGENYREHLGPLSVTFAAGGRHFCTVDGRRMAVDEDSYLVTNLGQSVSGTSECDPNAETFLIGFWPGFAEDVLHSIVLPTDQLLDRTKPSSFQPVEFFPQIYRHNELVSPLLNQLRCAIDCGQMTRGWLEEWNHRLLHRLLMVHRQIGTEINALPGVRAATRGEYYLRLNRARDYMEAHLEAALDLRQISGEAWLSPHHFLRLFKEVFGETPHQYLTRRRIERAQRLLAGTDLAVTDICYAVGFESLGSFSWLFHRRVGMSPGQYRQQNRIGRFIR